MIGPTDHDGVTDEELEIGWRIHGAELMGYHRIGGTRPWGWWVFEAGENKPRGGPEVETVRLAERGAITDEELAALREQANEAKLRIGTPAERISGGNSETGISVDRQCVELFQRVEAALRG
jgi:hypothetical protein